jgi:hypothetical protein
MRQDSDDPAGAESLEILRQAEEFESFAVSYPKGRPMALIQE